MYEYAFLLQVLFASNLCGGQIIPKQSNFGNGRNLEEFNNENPVTEVKWYFTMQRLNHFDHANPMFWNQRYFVNGEYYRPGGPVFLMIDASAENYIYSVDNTKSGAWIDYAKRFGALLFCLEHRYYGLSRPTDDTSVENLKYLNSQQALADAAFFITQMNQKYQLPEDVKWIAFGGSYPGALAAWLRLKYPHLVHGAIASSAPINPQVYYPGFYWIVTENFGNYSTECVSAIKGAFEELAKLLQDPSGQQQVKQMFQLFPFSPEDRFSLNDIAQFNKVLADMLSLAVLKNNTEHFYNISCVCDLMTNQKLGTPVNRLANYFTRNGTVFHSYRYDLHIDSLLGLSFSGDRLRQYQSCAEFGQFRVSNYPSTVFGDSLDPHYFMQVCSDVFGPKYGKDRLIYDSIDNIKMAYGGTDMKVTNVVFVQGSVDPWHILGAQKNISSKAPVIFIKGAGHSADMVAESPNDTPELKAAREQIATSIESWLKE